MDTQQLIKQFNTLNQEYIILDGQLDYCIDIDPDKIASRMCKIQDQMTIIASQLETN